ncbi:glycosyltransferase family 4 protein [Polynucleobacter paneuropaeus]|uniref:glycosyltransferase family 4 protein n=1 Tax=Polynucleobacter paneuropaeus TaxID=2527775 RepID=UPI001BFE15D1|nr:glycosyltransferase family 4 protein [Polynucleobacter paneuropaeus]QWD48035.1 glycosyltransferase family 4 protein [Polynucleobacter paneuropaeus]QWD52911.1 glycosyltransferase family 4 protein [Polynucleobacter paneuropaeus]QWD57825.1 glycosyltransferase family 4 protein [Polynucleobacter paneuropaeus]
MKIWIVNPYGALPSEGWREYRSSMLAKALASRGHEVIWWISDFDHRSKTYRKTGDIHDPLLPAEVRVVSVHASRYIKNISFGRIRYEESYGREFKRLALLEAPPDTIVMGDPSLFFSKNVLEYRNLVGSKLILDVIDLWPELFAVILPKGIRALHRLLFHRFYKRRSDLVAACDAVTAVSRDYLKIALKNQSKLIPNLVVYWGVDIHAHEISSINSEINNELSAFREKFSLIAVYAGTLGDAYDMDIIIAAIKIAKARNLCIGFIVAGDGPRKESFSKLLQSHSSHMKFLGALPSSDMATLYSNCDVGLMTYVSGSTVAMPIKFYDYLVGGLAILNSLDRDVREAIFECNIGSNYQPMNAYDLMNKLEELASDKSKLDLYKENSKILAATYDTKSQYQNFSDFIERVVRDKKSMVCV